MMPIVRMLTLRQLSETLAREYGLEYSPQSLNKIFRDRRRRPQVEFREARVPVPVRRRVGLVRADQVEQLVRWLQRDKWEGQGARRDLLERDQ